MSDDECFILQINKSGGGGGGRSAASDRENASLSCVMCVKPRNMYLDIVVHIQQMNVFRWLGPKRVHDI